MIRGEDNLVLIDEAAKGILRNAFCSVQLQETEQRWCSGGVDLGRWEREYKNCGQRSTVTFLNFSRAVGGGRLNYSKPENKKKKNNQMSVFMFPCVQASDGSEKKKNGKSTCLLNHLH